MPLASAFSTLMGVPYLRSPVSPDPSAGRWLIRGYHGFERGRALRQVSAIDLSVPAEELDGGDVRLEQLADLADALVEQVGAVRAHYEQLQRTLEVSESEPVATETIGGARPVEVSLEDHGDGSDAPQIHDSARLVVMEMAMSGSTREETKAYLRDALELEGGDPIVDEVFDRTEAAQESSPLRRRLFTRRRD
jgi:hypothetical protein